MYKSLYAAIQIIDNNKAWFGMLQAQTGWAPYPTDVYTPT